MLDNDLNNRHAENFSLYLNKDFFFDMMSTTLSKADVTEINKYIDLLKKNYKKVLAINEDNFISLICLLETAEILEFIGLMGRHPEVQYKLFLYIESTGEIDKVYGKASELYFTLLCQFDSKKVIEYLENMKYDIENILDLCQKLKNKRGYGYLKYKIGEFQETVSIYKELIEEEWEFSNSDGEYIKELVIELLGFNMDPHTKMHLIKVLGFLSQLPQRQELKKELIKLIFEKIFSFSIKDLLDEIEASRQVHLFLEDKILSTYLLHNFKNVVELNNSVVSILQEANYEAKNNFQEKQSMGKALAPMNCFICNTFIQRDEITFCYHDCKTMVHLSCVEKQNKDVIECPFCASQPKGRLISRYKDKRE